jgi:hypothetical protein
MVERTFLSLKFGDMGGLANSARKRIVFGAPGIDQGLAAALVNASKRLGDAAVTVLLDISEDNCRVGYGECEGYSILVAGGVSVRACPGLRIGFLLVDDDGYIFAMPALMVEDAAKRHAPNSIRATPDQILRLIDSTKPEFKAPTLNDQIPEQNSEEPSHFSASSHKLQATGPGDPKQPWPEIGTVIVSPKSIIEIADRIKANPVQDFRPSSCRACV